MRDLYSKSEPAVWYEHYLHSNLYIHNCCMIWKDIVNCCFFGVGGGDELMQPRKYFLPFYYFLVVSRVECRGKNGCWRKGTGGEENQE